MRRMSYGQGGQGQPPWDPWSQTSQRPQWGSQSDDRTPDWAALAEQSESRNKRRRVLLIGGGALATVAVGVAVAVAVVSANGTSQATNTPTNLPATADIPGGTSAAEPSFEPTSAPPPLDPQDFISSVKKDTAALSPEILFPGPTLTMGDRVYTKGPTADTADCASVVNGTLGTVLTKNDCTRLLRVTYSKGGIAVTVGVAVFDTEAQATKAKGEADAKSIITSLSGGSVKPFCDAAICRSTTNSYGRYAYFTIAGFTNGKDVTTKDTEVFTTGDDVAEFAFRQIRRRGEAQASTAANQ